MKFVFANFLAVGFIMLGKLSLTFMNVMLAYYFMSNIKSDNEMTNPYGPLCLIGFITFLLVSVFLGMYDEAVLSLMTCFCAD